MAATSVQQATVGREAKRKVLWRILPFSRPWRRNNSFHLSMPVSSTWVDAPPVRELAAEVAAITTFSQIRGLRVTSDQGIKAAAVGAANTRGKSMKSIKTMLVGTATLLAAALGSPAAAQDSSYKAGPIWDVSDIDIMPGQFENYMDYLATTWKKVQELGKAEGIVVDYHVLVNNNRRAGEADMYLVVVYRDYQTIAQQEAFEKKVNAMLAQDRRKATTASAERGKMREQLGSSELQELVLK